MPRMTVMDVVAACLHCCGRDASNEEEEEKEEPKISITVYQFTGQVGSRDRCLHSDTQFPSACQDGRFMDVSGAQSLMGQCVSMDPVSSTTKLQ